MSVDTVTVTFRPGTSLVSACEDAASVAYTVHRWADVSCAMEFEGLTVVVTRDESAAALVDRLHHRRGLTIARPEGTKP